MCHTRVFKTLSSFSLYNFFFWDLAVDQTSPVQQRGLIHTKRLETRATLMPCRQMTIRSLVENTCVPLWIPYVKDHLLASASEDKETECFLIKSWSPAREFVARTNKPSGKGPLVVHALASTSDQCSHCAPLARLVRSSIDCLSLLSQSLYATHSIKHKSMMCSLSGTRATWNNTWEKCKIVYQQSTGGRRILSAVQCEAHQLLRAGFHLAYY